MFARGLCFSLGLACILPAQILLPASDPSFLYLRRQFRRSHDLSLLTAPYPFRSSDFPASVYSPPPGDVVVSWSPTARLTSDRSVFDSGAWIAWREDQLSFLIEPRVVSKSLGAELFGASSYSRFGVRGSFVHSLLRWEGRRVSLQFGRSPVWWGQSWESSIIQSGEAPSYDHLDVRVSAGQFVYNLVAGQLGSVTDDDDRRIKRFLSGHRLMWRAANQKGMVTIGEQIIYTGRDRSIEMAYLNPFAPFSFSAYEKEQESSSFGDNDNAIYFVEGRWVPRPTLSFYGQWIVDDFQIDAEHRDDTPDALGWKIGADGAFTLLGRETTFEVEATRIDTWTYVHHGEFTNWHNRGLPIGFRHGPDSWSVAMVVDSWVAPKLLLSLQAEYVEHGEISITSPWSAVWTVGDPFPSGRVRREMTWIPSVSWHARQGIVSLGWDRDWLKGDGGEVFFSIRWVGRVGLDFE